MSRTATPWPLHASARGGPAARTKRPAAARVSSSTTCTRAHGPRGSNAAASSGGNNRWRRPTGVEAAVNASWTDSGCAASNALVCCMTHARWARDPCGGSAPSSAPSPTATAAAGAGAGAGAGSGIFTAGAAMPLPLPPRHPFAAIAAQEDPAMARVGGWVGVPPCGAAGAGMSQPDFSVGAREFLCGRVCQPAP